MKVLGRNGLRDAVGGYGTLPTNEAKIQEAGGSLRHRSICSNRFAFIIRVTSENCNAVPVTGAELMRLVRSSKVNGKSIDFYWLIYRDGIGGETVGHGKGVRSLTKRLAELHPSETQGVFNRNWRKTTDGKHCVKMWDDNANGATPFMKWVKVVESEDAQLRLIRNDIVLIIHNTTWT